jgi:hypothetical protein
VVRRRAIIGDLPVQQWKIHVGTAAIGCPVERNSTAFLLALKKKDVPGQCPAGQLKACTEPVEGVAGRTVSSSGKP